MPEPALIAIIGSGPAGLIAAEHLAKAGYTVTVCDRMPSPARKFLMAGRGGLNLTHSEDLADFLKRYNCTSPRLAEAITAFPPAALRAWCDDLGQPTFTGSSGRIFPESFKASPLLRAWLSRLDALGVRFAFRYTWTGWAKDGSLMFETPGGDMHASPDATLLALGGASWPRLGSDGAWVPILEREGIPISPLRPVNCGFSVAWSDTFRDRFAGSPLKPVVLSFGGRTIQGEAMIDARGIEGGAIYALSSSLREAIEAQGYAELVLDLRPGVTAEALEAKLSVSRGRHSLSNHLRRCGLSPISVALLYETAGPDAVRSMTPHDMTQALKSASLRLTAPFGIDRAISSSGGIRFDGLDDRLMLVKKPGVFAAGEMLDWEAPTGGYLLQACFATGLRAAQGMEAWLRQRPCQAEPKKAV